MTELLNQSIKDQVRDVFDKLQEPVALLFFGEKQDCEYCSDTRQLLEEVAALSDKLTLQVYDRSEHPEVAAQYHVDKVPGLVIAAHDGDTLTDYGVRFAGIPAGHEFSSLVQDIVLVSARDSGLDRQTREALKGLDKPLHLMVFVTPTCPYCPQAVVLAHRLAMENPLVQAEMVEATEFPGLAEQFGVSGVPQTTINNGAGTVVGAVPEAHLLEEVRRALAG